MNSEQAQQSQPFSNQSAPPPPTTNPPPSPKPRLPLLLGGLFVSLLILGGSYYFLASKETQPQTQPQPTQAVFQLPPTTIPSSPLTENPINDQNNPTTNWKIYTNTKYNYSIKYPQNWQEINDSLDDKLFADRQITEENFLNIVQLIIVVNKIPNTYETSKEYFDSIYNQDYSTPQSLQLETTLIKKFTMDGEPAIMLMEKGKPDSGLESNTSLQVYTYNNNNIYEIGLLGPNGLIEEYRSLFDQILSTFTILDQNQISPTTTISDETANWETYNSQKHSYSISYPNDWTVVESDSNGINILGMGKGSNEGFMYGGQNVLIEVASTNFSNEEYIKNNIAPNSNPINLGNITINNSTGGKWSFNDGTNSDNYAIFLTRNGKQYILIKELGNKSQFEDYNLEVDKVLSTFKFLE